MVILHFFQRVEPDINVKRECEEKIIHVDISIPDILKKKLEDDCFYINKRKKVLELFIFSYLYILWAVWINWFDLRLVNNRPCFSLLAGDGSLSDECRAHPRVLRQTLCHQQSLHGQREIPASAERHTEQQPTACTSRKEVRIYLYVVNMLFFNYELNLCIRPSSECMNDYELVLCLKRGAV